MGVNVNGLRFLLYAKKKGVDFARTAMLGRQRLRLSRSQLKRVANEEFGFPLSGERLQAICDHGYAEELLSELGAESVHSFDYSDFEDATHIHDFNMPVAEEHHCQYTALIEFGTLEHVFNVPAALTNCMRLVRPGGHILSASPANNYAGHGFYQFSPEFYYRVFDQHSGYVVEDMFMHAGREAKMWYTVPDPDALKRRVPLRTRKATTLLTLALRETSTDVLADPPQQSDYTRAWDQGFHSSEVGRAHSALAKLKACLPLSLKKRLKKAVSGPDPALVRFDPTCPTF